MSKFAQKQRQGRSNSLAAIAQLSGEGASPIHTDTQRSRQISTWGNQAIQRLLKTGTIQTNHRLPLSGRLYFGASARSNSQVTPRLGQLIQRQVESEEEEEEFLQPKLVGDRPPLSIQRKCKQCEQEDEAAIQPKLRIGQPNDKYEQEADRVADQVMLMPEPKIQRVCPECEEKLQRLPMVDEEEEETLQTKPLGEQITPLMQRQAEPMGEEETLQTKTPCGHPPIVSSGLQNRVTALQEGGQPLPQSERTFFETRFGADFSQVRVHADSQAAEASRAVKARAFTLGHHIVFNKGEYQPASNVGRYLLAHELAHTLQQRHSRAGPQIQRTITVENETNTTPPHRQNNGALVTSLFNQLCPSITWQLNGRVIGPANSSDCAPSAVQRVTTPTACDCACHFTNTATAGPHVRIEVNRTDNDTRSIGNNTFRIRITGQAAQGIRGIRGSAPRQGSPLVNVPDPAWLILGHELCGHAKTTLPLNPTSTATLFHQMSQDWGSTAVDIENRIRQEHNATFNAGLGIRIGEFVDVDGDIHAGSLIRLPQAMALDDLLRALDVPVRYKYPRCVRQDFFYPCTTIPTEENAMRNTKIVSRVTITHNGNQVIPWSCRGNSFAQGMHFNIEGVFWYRTVSGDTKQTITNRWGVSINALNRANRLFGNGIDTTSNAQALTAGTMVIIPYKSAPGSTRYFLRRTKAPC